MKKSETAKRLDAIAIELKELALSLYGEGEMRVGQWVIVTTDRYGTQGMVGSIESIYSDTIYVNLQGDVPCGYSHSDLEPAIPKEGDLVIAWTDPKEALICVYSGLWITQYSENHITNTGAFNNAIKWDGTKEQYERILKGE